MTPSSHPLLRPKHCSICLRAIIAAMICLLAFSSRAGTLLDDTFADGTRSNQSLPTDAAWFVSSSSVWKSAVGGLTVTNGSSAILGVTYFGTNSSSPVHLNVGDTLTVTVKYTFNGVAPANGSQGFKMGVYDFADSTLSPTWTTTDLSGNSVLGNGVAGYSVFQNMGLTFSSSSPMDVRTRTNLSSTSLLGTSGDHKSLITGPGNTNNFPGFSNGVQYSLQFTILRTNTTDIFLTVTWQNLANSATLTTAVVDSNANTFNFDGVAIRPSSAASSSTNITINEVKVDLNGGAGSAPSISLDPLSVSTYTGQTAYFSIISDGTAPLSYQWYRNSNTVITNATNSSLTISNAQVADSGPYYAIVTNAFGSDTSAVAQLTVTVPVGPTISVNPQSQSAQPGASVSFTVTAGGSTPLNYQWYYNTNTVIVGANDSTLTLNNIQATNAGAYSVVVNNLAGSATSAQATLTVNTNAIAPSFITQPASIVVVAGGTASFSGSVSGSAPIYYQWKKNGSVIPGATSSSLQLTNVQNSDSGSYSLLASNSIGTALSVSASLTVSSGVLIPNSAYNLTGFGRFATGGGYILDTDPAYRKVTNGLDLANALVSAYKTSGSVKVIEIMNDLDLGWNEVGSAVQNLASTPFRSHNAPQLHPRLLVTGVSLIDIKPRTGLTIFSANGATIRHATFNIKSTGNIIVRNLKFDEMWEWDEATKGQYDKNDWDFIDLGNGGSVSNIWVDHCTFSKTYDGILDTKAGSSGITISWCKYTGDDGASNTNSWVRQQINTLESNKNSYAFYGFLRNNGFSVEDIVSIIQGHDKTHLAGANDLDPNNATISMTFHHLLLSNVWDRCVPRLRAGNVHDYNIYADDTLAYAAKALRNLRASAMSSNTQNTLNNTYSINPPLNGSISTENGALLVEKSVYVDCLTPLRNNQTDVNNPAYTGKIAALDSIYQLGSTFFRGNSTDAGGSNTFGPVQAPIIAFSWNNLSGNQLPYTYTMDDPSELQGILTAGTGAGAVAWNKTNWLLTSYAPTAPVISANPQSLSLSAGNTANFTVVVSGSGPLSYIWRFNTNNVISGATNSVLNLTNVQTTNAGTYFVIVSNSAGAVTSSVASLTISSGATGFAAWQATQFSAAQLTNSSISGPAATPAGDGVPNLVKYALGQSAFTPSVASKLTSIAFTNGSWTLLYRRPAGASDVVYDPQTSSNLFSWTDSNVVQQLLGTDTNSLQIWGANFTGSQGARRFYQLRLHQ